MDPSEQLDQLDFATIWEQYSDTFGYTAPRRGDIREATLLRVSPGEIVLDIGSKQDAVIAPNELSSLPQQELASLRVGKTLPVYILRTDQSTGQVVVSIEMAREYTDWLRAEALLETGEIIQSAVVGYNKGGLLCEFGRVQGFVPASQVLYGAHPGRQGDSASMIGATLALKVIEVNRNRRRLILSERAAAREWRVQQRERLLDEIEVGDVRSGTVSNLCEFGAFVDLGGMDGLVHLSELAWERVSHPREVVQIGDTVSVVVLNVDRERQRIGLSLKRTLPDPWKDAAAAFGPGMVVAGTVTHLVSFGVFVQLMPGVEGLVHTSELDASGAVVGIDIVEGAQLSVDILGMDPVEHRISLGIHSLGNDDAADAGDTQESQREAA
ncbi:MAG: 30S ribosomal protein S1 [Anaerolineae bacterium]|jgi:small subunit ribosomal protein S1